MPKPNIPNQRKANLQHKKRVEQYAVLIQQIYDRVAKEDARQAVLVGADPEKPFNFADYPLTKVAIKKLQSKLMDEVSGIILRGTSEEWKESNLIQDLVARKVLTAYTGTSKYGDEYSRYFQTNPDALKAFQERKDRGMNLSSSVWKLSEQYKSELEESITAAIAPGTSATSLAAQIKQYLKYPDKRFRRIKEKLADGTIKWHLSNPAKAYHPGSGVYRSSARNAQRLARTEINMSYRTAEQERWKQFDFVVGYEVKTTQNGHHVEDMCDMLAGKYPKTFKFTGWHPQCMCYCIPILKTEDEFWADDDVKSVNEVTDVPQNFKEWIRDNSDRIEAAEKRGNLPYFIRDNKDDVEGVLHPEWFENLKYFSKEDFKSIQEGNFFGSVSIIKLNDILTQKGFTEDEIKQLSHLIDLHRAGGENQIDTDIELALHFRDKNSRIGEMLRMQSKIEEEAYRIYRYKNPPIEIVRSGDLSRDTFSFTMNKDGVVKIIDGEEQYWGTNIRTTLDSILKENKLVAGLLRSDIGYSDERELFFISKKPKQLTESFIKDWKEKLKQKRIETERKEILKEFNQTKNEIAMQLMSLASKGVPMDKIITLQGEFFKIKDGDTKSLNRIASIINAAEHNIDSKDTNHPHYGAAMKLGRSATKEAMKVVENIGAPELTEVQKKNIYELADALGITRKDVKPMSFLDADQGASNPTKDYENCQSVVVAFEARRRGIDCYAMPYSSKSNSASYILGERFQDAWLNPKTGKVIEPTIFKGNSDDIILSKLKKGCPSDGRYILGINYKDGGGHVMSIEKINGKIILRDEQIDDFYDISSLKNISYLEILRIDKAILNIDKVKSVLGLQF